MDDVAGRIRGFIVRELQVDEETKRNLTGETSLIDGGIVDSLGLMELMAFLEEEFDIEIDDADIRVDHFRTIGDIAQLVNRLAGEQRDEVSPAPTA